MGTLYVVGTPIGNLEDFSPRGRRTLEEVDFIAAEDTRVTHKLLSHFGIKKPMISYYEHNTRQRREEILSRLEAGENCAVVTDAGMPCISDPGEDVVRQCRQRGIPVKVVPGPSAVVSALAVSGLDTTRFAFEGFLSVKKNSRREHLAEIRQDRHTLIFYEAPHKLLATLEDLLEALGDRRISVVRELTKIYEEVLLTTLEKAVEYYRANTPRGEFVLVVEGAPQPSAPESCTLEEAAALVRRLAEEGESLSTAAKEVARQTGYQKGELYRLAAREEA